MARAGRHASSGRRQGSEFLSDSGDDRTARAPHCPCRPDLAGKRRHPAQTIVGIHLALGKTKSAIADELGLQLSSVADHSKKLYQTLDVHNSTELGTKIWLNQKQDAARQYLRRAG